MLMLVELLKTYHHTTHENPYIAVDGIVHYGADNIPCSLQNYIYSLCQCYRTFQINSSKWSKEACRLNGYLRRSMTSYMGVLTHEETSAIQGREWVTPEEMLGLEEGTYSIAPKAGTSSKPTTCKNSQPYTQT